MVHGEAEAAEDNNLCAAAAEEASTDKVLAAAGYTGGRRGNKVGSTFRN